MVNGPILTGLFVKENDLNCVTEQRHMSDGMFRAISLIIKINYSIRCDMPVALLVDDIGEGLDFSRSRGLIEIAITKAEKSGIKLLMSTNDQFVMNGVSLDYWAIANRSGSKVSFINVNNSPELFDKFKFIGLNNFDFFAEGFYQDTE